MIHLQKGQKLFDNEGMVVYDQTGYYNDDDSIICAMVYAPEEPVCRYEAKFVAYGSNVYNITDPEKLLEEIKKIDPETLFGKKNENVREQQIVDSIQTNVSEDLSVTQDQDAAATDSLANEKLSSEMTPTNNSNTVDPLIVPNTSTSTPDIITNTNTATASTTSSSTPPVTTPQIDFSTATTTSTPSTFATSTQTDGSSTTTEPVIEKIIPAIENVIDQLNTISDIVESGTSTGSGATNLTL